MKELCLILGLLLSGTALGQADESTFFTRVNDFLINNVDQGRIRYNALKFNDQNLSVLVNEIKEFNLNGKDQDFKLAFYLNAYNLLVIKQVLENYPIKSPLDVPGFFKENKFKVAGEFLTLDEIEFKKIVAPTQDPRIHFALGCAAISCPSLYDNAFTPDHVQEQLEFRAQLVIDGANYVQVDQEAKKITLNKIFDWYSDQFISTAGSLIAYINKYRFYKVDKSYTIIFQEYDWQLNNKEK